MKNNSVPGLLFTGGPRRDDVPPEVFRDLKLDRVLGPGAIPVMSGICPRSDISARQELFAEIAADKDILSGLKEQLGLARLLGAVDREYRRRSTPAARAVVFAGLADLYCRFCGVAARTGGNGFFLKRHADHFRSVVSDGTFKALCSEVGAYTAKYPSEVAGIYRTGARVCAPDGEKTGLIRLIADPGADSGRETVRPSDALAETLASLDAERAEAASSLYQKYSSAYDPSVIGLCGELEFIISVNALFAAGSPAGDQPHCFPRLTAKREITAKDARDVTLLCSGVDVVPNDIFLTQKEPFFFLSGANGGGKTTYLRTVGVNVLLALSGAPVSAREFSLGPVDGVFTHFPGDEKFEGERRCANEKRRADAILNAGRSMPLVLLNETFSTTNEIKSRRETDSYATRLIDYGALGVYVTHTPGVRAPGAGSLICAVDERDGSRRTFRVVRSTSAGGAHAVDLIAKYGLDLETLKKRFAEKTGGGDE